MPRHSRKALVGLEIEVKFAVVDFGPLRARLQGAGAVFLSRVFEENEVYDAPGGELRAKGVLLRLRRDAKARLTLKLPCGDEAPAGFKTRKELETTVGDFGVAAAIFGHLGYVASLRYEKMRETWRYADALVCLDQLPYGLFVEIEGTPETIAMAAAALGLGMQDASTASYLDLFHAHLDAKGLARSDSFVFPPDEGARLRSLCAATMSED